MKETSWSALPLARRLMHLQMWTMQNKLDIKFCRKWPINKCQQSASKERRRLWLWALNLLSRLEVSESVSIHSCFSSVFCTFLVVTCPNSKRFSSMNWQPCPYPCLTTAGSCDNPENTSWQSTCGMIVKATSSTCWVPNMITTSLIVAQ